MISAVDSVNTGSGLYSFPEVAKYLHVHPRTLRSWFSAPSKCGHLLKGTIQHTKDGGAWLGFHDFLQAYAVNALKVKGVKPEHVREALRESKDKYGLPYPMSMKGFQVFADDEGKVVIIPPGDHPTDLTGRRKGQRNLLPIISNYLNRLEFKGGMASKFIVHYKDFKTEGRKRVVMSPGINFGEPTVEGTCYRATTLRDALRVEGSRAAVVRLYGVAESDVILAVEACRVAPVLKDAA